MEDKRLILNALRELEDAECGCGLIVGERYECHRHRVEKMLRELGTRIDERRCLEFLEEHRALFGDARPGFVGIEWSHVQSALDCAAEPLTIIEANVACSRLREKRLIHRVPGSGVALYRLGPEP